MNSILRGYIAENVLVGRRNENDHPRIGADDPVLPVLVYLARKWLGVEAPTSFRGEVEIVDKADSCLILDSGPSASSGLHICNLGLNGWVTVEAKAKRDSIAVARRCLSTIYGVPETLIHVTQEVNGLCGSISWEVLG